MNYSMYIIYSKCYEIKALIRNIHELTFETLTKAQNWGLIMRDDQ